MESALRNRIMPGLKLIETLLWDGSGFPRLAGHQARLAHSAACLGWSADRAWSNLPAFPDSPSRVRLTLDALGQIEVTQAPLPASPPLWRLGPAPTRLRSDDPWLRLKSTHRAQYDSARAAMPASLDELIFLNEQGAVCDGTITTLFFDAGSGLCTPPLSAGLLPGVLRAELIAQGRCTEAPLRAEQLATHKLWVGNALRGLMPAEWSTNAVAQG